ncbi:MULTISPECIES: hypothetical protein [Flavobacteriaceae]|uniref:hypothetical protein n=1 Tax=Flavobacteriaceae TaxID=49546 RepID=UPI001492699E|nr:MULTISPECIES: hypothetical protein [Allomuricauda]MDC6364629.1 hypothetical protein [Muricauda sp. AC10]
MNLLSKILTWKLNGIVILITLLALVVLNFYGIYTNRFYFFKPDNYIFPILSLIHFVYLYVVWFKITEQELPDPKMRNLEYGLYAVTVVYLYKIYDSVQVYASFSEYEQHVIPPSFEPIAIVTIVLYSLLAVLTIFSFWQRKQYVGVYNFEDYNNNLNIWQ